MPFDELLDGQRLTIFIDIACFNIYDFNLSTITQLHFQPYAWLSWFPRLRSVATLRRLRRIGWRWFSSSARLRCLWLPIPIFVIKFICCAAKINNCEMVFAIKYTGAASNNLFEFHH